MPERLPDFQRTQQAFASYIRDPSKYSAPADVRPERMAMYRELFVNNIDSFLATGFPLLRAILDDDAWRELVHDFFARHRCTTPYFTGIPEEFLDYLREERVGCAEDPPYLLELAHYEWVELALSVDQGTVPGEPLAELDNLLTASIYLSDVAWPLAYRFPVHRIGPEFLPTTEPTDPTFLAVYRDREDAVRFMELNAVSYRVLQLIDETGGHTGLTCLTQLARELAHPHPEMLRGFGQQLLANLATRGIIGLSRSGDLQ